MIVEKMKSLLYFLCLFRQFWVLRYYDSSNPPLVYSNVHLVKGFVELMVSMGAELVKWVSEDWC
jgi:hypothetical protein